MKLGLKETDKLLLVAAKKKPAKEIARLLPFGLRIWKKKNSRVFSYPYPLKLKILLFPFSYLSNYIIAFGQRYKNYRVGQNMGKILIKLGVLFVFFIY